MSKPADDRLSRRITRRDFIGTTLVGAGAALLSQACPAQAQIGRKWTGPGGIGDYGLSNGNTADVVRSAHLIRDNAYDNELPNVIDVDELYDVVIVGGGFAGIVAMYEFRKRRPSGTCLLIDNHSIFGGFAKQNEFEVDGYRLAGPQASINFLLPGTQRGLANDYWHELGLPEKFAFAEPEGGNRAILFPKATSSGVYWAEQCASIGYYFQNEMTQHTGVWVKNIWNDDLKRAPWPNALKKDLLALRDNKPQHRPGEEDFAWLDDMAYAEFLMEVMGLGSEVLQYITPIMGIVGQSPAVSAYGARLSGMPGVSSFPGRSPLGELGDRWMSFPGGNTTLLRHFVKALIPDAIAGAETLEDVANRTVNFHALDRAGSHCRMRLNATSVRVRHEGSPKRSDHVSLVYEQGGRLYRIKAKAAVLCIGSWVTKHVVTDLPPEYLAAFNQFLYGSILIVNVALRNWRFLDKLGVSAARWFDGFGFYSTVRQPMVVGGKITPFHPDKPIVMTLYVPIQRPDLPLVAQGPAARSELFATPYADYERQIVAQMERLFSAGGFNARRDIAGIVLNRWGHAFLSAQPGFFFATKGQAAPLQIVRQRFGRIAFGHSELAGAQSWTNAAAEGKRAVTQLLDIL